MKSVLQACWLVTTAFGDLIVVILSVSKPVDGVVSLIIAFIIMMSIIKITLYKEVSMCGHIHQG